MDGNSSPLAPFLAAVDRNPRAAAAALFALGILVGAAVTVWYQSQQSTAPFTEEERAVIERATSSAPPVLTPEERAVIERATRGR